METKTLQQPRIKTLPADVEFDFDSYAAELDIYVQQYNLVVTAETVKDAKKAATELNKLSNAIKTGFKAHIDELKKPAGQLTDYSKQLQEKCQAGRSGILEQVEKFEAERLAKGRELATAFLNECREEYKVTPDYYAVDIESHIKLGTTNDSGTKLSKAARDAIESAVKDEFSLQQQTELRLSNLENASYKAGLDAPITRRHVDTFLFANQQIWEANLKSVIDAEIERQEIARESQRKRFEAEQAEKQRQEELQAQEVQEAPREECIEPEPVQPNEPQQEPQQDTVQSDTGSRTVSVWVRFDIDNIPAHIPNELVGAKVKSELHKLGKTVAEVRA